MNNPKISVLIPMYNRKHYIAQAVDSALNQTFKDFEIIIRDDGSTDGSADFVAEKYAAEIFSGKIKLRRNEKNIGEFPTDNRLLREATGKYIMLLHSDDMYLPHGLQHMYEVAERFKADVVHECVLLTTAPDGVITDEKSLILKPYDKNPVDKVAVMSSDPLFRFNMWLNDVQVDAQHNIFSRKFLVENDLQFETFGGNRLLALKWLMKAKVLVKTPLPFYVYRNSPDSNTNSKFPPERVAKFISDQIELSRHLDEFFSKDNIFRNHKELQYLARSELFSKFGNWWIVRKGVYSDGITPELNQAVELAFRKYFGDDAPFPAFLFHWIHSALHGKPVNELTLPPQPNH